MLLLRNVYFINSSLSVWADDLEIELTEESYVYTDIRIPESIEPKTWKA